MGEKVYKPGIYVEKMKAKDVKANGNAKAQACQKHITKGQNGLNCNLAACPTILLVFW